MIFKEPIPLSLYIHLPWCVRKCPYCDFNSHTQIGELKEQAYIARLLQELEQQLPTIWGRRLVSIFIGGGTPSLFSAKSIKYLLQEIHARLAFHPDIEITMEANPGTFEQEKFAGFRQAGINRLSIGVQSFNAAHLKRLGRIHDNNEALKAVAIAKQAGFDNINIDLMFALPQQTLTEALNDVQQAIDLQPQHVSWYQLTIEPNTVFYKTQPSLPQDDDAISMQEQGQALLTKNGFKQYEISAYAQTDKQCQHNLNYWQFGDYLGIGAGAHSKITDMQKQTITRHNTVRQPNDYLNPQKAFIAKQHSISEENSIFEFLMNALRLKAGVKSELFTQRCGLSLEKLQQTIQRFIDENLIYPCQQQIKTTELGYHHLNAILSQLL